MHCYGYELTRNTVHSPFQISHLGRAPCYTCSACTLGSESTESCISKAADMGGAIHRRRQADKDGAAALSAGGLPSRDSSAQEHAGLEKAHMLHPGCRCATLSSNISYSLLAAARVNHTVLLFGVLCCARPAALQTTCQESVLCNLSVRCIAMKRVTARMLLVGGMDCRSACLPMTVTSRLDR